MSEGRKGQWRGYKWQQRKRHHGILIFALNPSPFSLIRSLHTPVTQQVKISTILKMTTCCNPPSPSWYCHLSLFFQYQTTWENCLFSVSFLTSSSLFNCLWSYPNHLDLTLQNIMGNFYHIWPFENNGHCWPIASQKHSFLLHDSICLFLWSHLLSLLL